MKRRRLEQDSHGTVDTRSGGGRGPDILSDTDTETDINMSGDDIIDISDDEDEMGSQSSGRWLDDYVIPLSLLSRDSRDNLNAFMKKDFWLSVIRLRCISVQAPGFKLTTRPLSDGDCKQFLKTLPMKAATASGHHRHYCGSGHTGIKGRSTEWCPNYG